MRSDRRVQYTKRVLRESLMALLHEKPLEKISVKEICERADINRSTFYVYYGSPRELLNSIFEEMLSDLSKNVQDYHDTEFFLCAVCEALWGYRDLMLAVASSQDVIGLLFRLTDIWKDQFLRMAQSISLDGETADLAYRYISAGACFAMGTWVISGKGSAAETAQCLNRLIKEGLSAWRAPSGKN